MGKWVFRIDERVESAGCDTDSTFNRIRIQPAFHSINAGKVITVTGTPSFKILRRAAFLF